MNKRLPLSSGTVLNGRYKIITILGKGGMGNVYQAINIPVSASVALKETFADDNDTRQQFEREAKLLANLHHEAFPRVSDHFIEGDGQYLVMEMIEGDDLAELLKVRKSAFELETVLDWAEQILDALEDLHAKNIFHRDIKPANLKPTRRNKIKLLDFGLAKGLSGDMTTEMVSSYAAGTIAFAPLEQIIKSYQDWFMFMNQLNSVKTLELLKSKSDAGTDLYALGATLYQLLTNRPPETAPARALGVWTGKPDPLRPIDEFNEDVPSEITNILNKAMSLEREDRYRSAKEMRETLIEARKPKIVKERVVEPIKADTKPLLTPSDYVERAELHWENSEYDKAIALCDIAIEHDQKLVWAYNVRGGVYNDKGEYDEAIKDYTKAIESDPNDADAYINRGVSYDNKGEYNKAIKDCTKAIELDPNDADAYYNRGISYDNKGEYDEAIKDYTKAIESDPTYAVAYNNRGISYDNKGEYEQAFKDYTKAIKLDPNYADAYINRGVSYDNEGEYDEAIKDYTKAIESDPSNSVTYINRGVSYKNKGEYNEAIKDYTKAIELDSNDAGAYYNRGISYKKKGEYDEAIKDYTKAIELDPTYAVAYNNRGISYDNKGEYGEAIKDYTKAIELDPTCAINYKNRAISYEKIGETAKARADRKRAKELKGEA